MKSAPLLFLFGTELTAYKQQADLQCYGFGLGDFYIDCDLQDRDGNRYRMNLSIFYCPIRYE